MSFMLSELMESKWLDLAMLVLAFLMLGGGGWCEGCLDEERVALSQLKPFFPFIDYTVAVERPRLDDYFGEDYDSFVEEDYYSVEEKESSLDCCKWDRVECNPTTGRVIKLFLDVPFPTSMNDFFSDHWYLNASLFLPFEELKNLSLSGNSIAGCVVDQGFERLSSRLNKLEILDLSSNHFNNNILASISELSSLKSLILSDNEIMILNHNNGIKMLSKLKNLEILDLSSNFLESLNLKNLGSERTVNLMEFNSLVNLKELYLDSGIESLGSSFQELGLKNLSVLGLGGNPLDNSMLSTLGRLPNLKTLSFEVTQQEGSIDIINDGCSFSLQLLGLFPSLKTLSLDGFSVEETKLHSHSQTKWQRLTNLEELKLQDSSIRSSFIGALPSLKKLYISYYYLDDSLFMQELDGLSNLEELLIDCNSGCRLPLRWFDLFPSLKTLFLRGLIFNDTTTTFNFQDDPLRLKNLEILYIHRTSLGNNFLRKIRTLPSLKILSLWNWRQNNTLNGQDRLQLKILESLRIYGTSLEGNFLQKIGAMPSLKILRLSECGLNATLHNQGFCGLTNLQKLDMSNNNLKGNLPECFSNFTSLESLDLSSNYFSGDVSVLETLTSLKSLDISSNQFRGNVFALKVLTSLTALSLSNNYFEIPSSLEPFFDLSKLKRFRADNNTIYVESEMQSSVPRFQLNEISLSCCGDAGQFPQFLYYQRGLWDVDLSNINLKGGFPNWLLQNNTNLRGLNLANNSLRGHFELHFLPHTGLSYLDISKNFFYGKVPIEIWAKLPSLSYLNMSRNHFHGSIPASIGDMNFLEYLDLSDNQLSGGLPEHLAMGCSSLFSLTLSNNRLQGQMFSSKINLPNLMELRLDGNHFSGKIPDSLSNCSRLSTLDVSNNELSGEIPRWMGNMSSLREIVMAQNHLEGPFPIEFCNPNLRLKLLDLSANNISGHIPSCFSPLQISQVHLSRNKLEGPLTNAFRKSTILVTLDLSYNHLTGNIPNWIGNLSQLSYLLLKSNHFEGRIPLQLCNLDHLSLIDLSNNNLSGIIPPCLKITTLNEISQEYVRYVAAVDAVPQPPSSFSDSFSIDEPIQFTSKNNSYTYKGKVLTYLSGIDLSCNKLTGGIPRDVKNFRNIYALNLSHNSLIGPIPLAFSDLKQIESLDLSHNNLSGIIPPQLVGLTSLSYFSVAYNNLSGSIPEMTAQFSTFDERSYVGNPLLCGKPLQKTCSTSRPPPSILPKASNDNNFIDMTAFYGSFAASYVVVILSIASVLYINPYWRRAWFYHTGEISKCCYYFLEDHILPRRFYCGN